MKRTVTRTVAALSLALLALTGCGSNGAQSGESNPDNQIDNPPFPSGVASPPTGG